MCYHGNGVAMGSFCGKLLADLIQGRCPEHYPQAARRHMQKFLLGRARRLIMLPIYAGLRLADR
ncbi:hypothetical protein ROLI_000640 [Roseobacter fucihabitans]|uniref:FAD dependent oxidoreductase domain-containing protein n=2 Tax=Roseobacter fucihabitans TaxID=1537242 RepID=A0ABZ2BNU8_9RHOB|nr:hypothetical protein [Roseobacter litoralis]